MENWGYAIASPVDVMQSNDGIAKRTGSIYLLSLLVYDKTISKVVLSYSSVQNVVSIIC